VKLRFAVVELAVSTSSSKSICIRLPLPSRPRGEPEMIAAELLAFGAALTSR